MKMTRTTVAGLCAIGFGAISLACGSDTASDGVDTGSARAALRASLKGEAPGRGSSLSRGPAGVRQAVVSVDWVKAHGNGGWVTLREGPSLSVDLMRLPEEAADLGLTHIVGRVDQIRLHVDGTNPPYVITNSGERHDLKVPSGEQSGIKLRGLWQVGACEDVRAEVTLGADSIKIHETEHGDLYVMRPVIRGHTTHRGHMDSCDPSTEPVDPSEHGEVSKAGEDEDHHPGLGDDDENGEGDEGDGHHGDRGDPDHHDGGGICSGGRGDDQPEMTAPSEPGTPDPGSSDPTTPDPTDPSDTTPPDSTTPTDPSAPASPGSIGAACESHDQCSMGLFCDSSGRCASL